MSARLYKWCLRFVCGGMLDGRTDDRFVYNRHIYAIICILIKRRPITNAFDNQTNNSIPGKTVHSTHTQLNSRIARDRALNRGM